MRQVAFIVGIEEYLDENINPAKFVHNDVLKIADTLKRLGLPEDEITILISKGATKTVICSKLKKLVNSLSKEDGIYFYYAGHGFSRNNINYITCNDTLLNDLENTSIALQDIFRQFTESIIRQSILFIDSCHSGLPFDASSRGIYSNLSDEELFDFLADAKGCICFSACKGDEESFSSPLLKHGIWSYHVIKALSGNAPMALENMRILTPGSLQNYLSKEVPLAIRKLRVPSDTQTPWMCGAMSKDLLIADVGHILTERMQKSAPIANQLRKAMISSIHMESVKSLSGFKRGSHTVPKEANNATQRFIENISKHEIEDRLNHVHDGLRKHLKYKRLELETSYGDGRASIITPKFDYHLEIAINEDDPSTVIFHEFIENISDGHIILSDDFNSAFSRGFNAINFIFQHTISIEGVIDALEKHSDARLKLEYDASYTRLEIEIDKYGATIVIEPDRLVIEVARPIAPKLFLPIAEEGLKQITSNENFAMLPLMKDKELNE